MANIHLKSEHELELMQQSGQIVADTLLLLKSNVRPGITTLELNDLARDYIRSRGGIASFPLVELHGVGFPGVACISVNEEVVHGIPSKRVLRDGDVVSLDIGVILNGYHGDAAITVAVGKIATEAQRLLDVTESALALAIHLATPGRAIYNLAAAVQDYVEGEGFSVVRNYVGHGVGRNMHEDPTVPNYRSEGPRVILRPGMVIAIEPMVNAGKVETEVLDDGWTVVTQDRRYAAHFEHTVAVTATGPRILTRPSDENATWGLSVPSPKIGVSKAGRR